MRPNRTQFDVPDRLFLDEEELFALTDTAVVKEQEKVLRANRIEFFKTYSGSLRVSRQILDGGIGPRKEIRRPKFDLVPCRQNHEEK